jgi:hypothetical protein
MSEDSAAGPGGAMLGCGMHSHLSRLLPKLLLAFIVASAAFVAPAMSQATSAMPQATPKKVDLYQLSCGQKVLIDDQSCQAGQILEVTGSCLNTEPVDGTRRKGIQYNCMKRK